MIFYRVSLVSGEMGHRGYIFYTSMRDAQKKQRHWMKDGNPKIGDSADIDRIETGDTKSEILSLLNHYASHERNG